MWIAELHFESLRLQSQFSGPSEISLGDAGHRGNSEDRLHGYSGRGAYHTHEALESKTPSEAAGIKVQGANKWATIIQTASRTVPMKALNEKSCLAD
jgi:hypothetical protein